MPVLAIMDPPPQTQSVVKHETEADENDLFDEGEDDEDADMTYRPRPQLSQPIVLMRPLSYLMNGLETKFIDVDPDYQREVVWAGERMTGLINSLMENYYIPPIILNKKEHPDSNGATKKYTQVCVDGKQRLSSVQAFIKGIIPCHDHRGQKWWFCDSLSGRSRKVIPESMQKEFLAKEFVSFEFADLSPEQEEDLFARVQKGMQLTLAEKMRASTGPWQELAKAYVDDFPSILSLLKATTRAKDFQMVLACFSQIVEVQHPTAANGIPGLRTNAAFLPRLLENKAALDDRLRAHLAVVFRKFNHLIALEPNAFTNADKRFKVVQTFAPVEMVAIVVLISLHAEERNDRLLLGDIRYFREVLRENFTDLKLNAPCWKFIWGFLDNLEQVRGSVNGGTIDRNTEGRDSATIDAPPATQAALITPTPRTTPASIPPLLKKRGRPKGSFKNKPEIVPLESFAAVSQPSSSAIDLRQYKRPRVELPTPCIKYEPKHSSPLPPFPTTTATTESSHCSSTLSPTVALNPTTSALTSAYPVTYVSPYAPPSKYNTGNARSSDLSAQENLPANHLAVSKPKDTRWYGVQVGFTPGVYTDWNEVKRQTYGCPGQKQRRFDTEEEAWAFVNAGKQADFATTSLNTKNISNATPASSSSSGGLVTTAQARQNRISDLNGYRAPVAQMGATGPQTSPTIMTYAPQAPTTPEIVPNAPFTKSLQESTFLEGVDRDSSASAEARLQHFLNTTFNPSPTAGAFPPGAPYSSRAAHSRSSLSKISPSSAAEARAAPARPKFTTPRAASSHLRPSTPAAQNPDPSTAPRFLPAQQPSQTLTGVPLHVKSTAPGPPLAQLDGVMDLTDDPDDSEQARQNLLLSFCGRAKYDEVTGNGKTSSLVFDDDLQ